MKSIYEVKETIKKLSKDFELVGNLLPTTNLKQTKQFLKQLDARVEELGLDYEQCREAARLFKKGDFKEALIKIWGRAKVKIESENSDAGAVTKVTYVVKDYAEFTEWFIRKGINYYIHKIEGSYLNNPTPSYPLGTIIHVEERLKDSNFSEQQERANRQAYMSRSVANIYNILFVGFDGYDVSSALSKFHIKLKNKL